MQCPKCVHRALRPRKLKHKEVVLDACPECQGAWFDADELNRILPVASRELAVPADAEETSTICPRCSIPLTVFDYPQTYVAVGMCPRCFGLWLDHGEFTEIKAVRQLRQSRGELEVYAPVGGVKGKLLQWVDGAIATLSQFD